MMGNLWTTSSSMAERLGLDEKTLSSLREKGIMKPGIHWKSDPYGQTKPWNPVPIYNIKLCEKLIKGNLVNIFDDYAA
tara:strand:- start:269 stop:502 length:234 start_codon:yes stop_codon:yes gene_type:complete